MELYPNDIGARPRHNCAKNVLVVAQKDGARHMRHLSFSVLDGLRWFVVVYGCLWLAVDRYAFIVGR